MGRNQQVTSMRPPAARPRARRGARPALVDLRPAVAALLLAGAALPRPAALAAQVPRFLSDSARISLVTILPGDRVYSLFGHSAIRVRDPARGMDQAYNYGTFHFGNPLAFSAKFAYGKLDYYLSVQSHPRAVDHYWRVEGRPVIEQWLDLDAAQREAVFRFLEENARPENRVYRYDFYFDNCATRIRDVFEDVLGEAVEFDAPDPRTSLRGLLDQYLVERPLLHLGMDLGQGLPADRPASGREATFLPEYLADYLAAGTLRGSGGDRPLVARTDTVAWSPERAVLSPAPPWPSVGLWALLALVIVVTVADARGRRTGRRWLDVPFYALLGAAGLLVAFLSFVSLHGVTDDNLNILWALPTHLVAAGVLLRRSPPGWLRVYWLGAAALAGGMLAGWPLWNQEIPTAIIPVLLAVVVRSVGLAWLPAPLAPAAEAVSG